MRRLASAWDLARDFPLTIACSFLLLVALTSCSTTQTPSAGAASTPSAVSPSTSPSARPSPSGPTPAPSDVGYIGGAARILPGGVTIEIGVAKRYRSSGVGGTTRTGDTLAIYPIAVTNDGQAPIDMTLTAVNAYARGGVQVDMLSDSEHPADNHFSGTLLPGKTMTATYGFLVRKSDAGNMQIEVFVGDQGQAHGVFIDPESGVA